MERIVEGTYTSTDEAVKAIERLLNEGYLAEEMLIITDDKHEVELENLTLVDVEAVEEDEKEESFWDKIKETFRMGNYNKENEINTLIEHGVDAEMAEHFNASLEKHEIIILTDSTAPAHSKHLSTVNEEVLTNEEPIFEVENKTTNTTHNQPEPSEVDTKEAMNPAPGEDELFDPSKSQSAREDVPGASTVSSPDKDKHQDAKPLSEKSDKLDINKNVKEELPQLTGDETTVETVDEDHVYPDNISKGVVGEPTDETPTINAKQKKGEHPEPDKNIPVSDAYYSDKYEDAGGKTIKDDEE